MSLLQSGLRLLGELTQSMCRAEQNFRIIGASLVQV